MALTVSQFWFGGLGAQVIEHGEPPWECRVSRGLREHFTVARAVSEGMPARPQVGWERIASSHPFRIGVGSLLKSLASLTRFT